MLEQTIHTFISHPSIRYTSIHPSFYHTSIHLFIHHTSIHPYIHHTSIYSSIHHTPTHPPIQLSMITSVKRLTAFMDNLGVVGRAPLYVIKKIHMHMALGYALVSFVLFTYPRYMQVCVCVCGWVCVCV